MARRGGDWGTVAVRTTGTAASASGVGKKRAARIWGGKREAQGPRGERGEWERGPRRRGGAGALILPVAGEVVRRGPAPVPTPVGGTGKGASGRGGLGRGSAQSGQGSSGGKGLLLFFLCLFCFLLYFLFIYLFSFLFYFI